jgi:hypothetical protein
MLCFTCLSYCSQGACLRLKRASWRAVSLHVQICGGHWPFFSRGIIAPKQGELEKRKNDEETEEGWVQCDVCECWVHQICGLFNKGRNKEETPYVCPMCLLDGARSPLGPSHICAIPTLQLWHAQLLSPFADVCSDAIVAQEYISARCGRRPYVGTGTLHAHAWLAGRQPALGTLPVLLQAWAAHTMLLHRDMRVSLSAVCAAAARVQA